MTDPGPMPEPRDVSISMERANSVALLLLPVFTIALLAPFVGVWGWGALKEGGADVFRLWVFVPGFLAAIVVHEGLHALGFLLFGRAPPDSVHFGVHRPTMSPFAGCHVPLTVRAYRGAVALPALVLGAAPWIWGMTTGAGWGVVGATVMTIAAAGDIMVLWIVRGLPGNARVMDHPERVGCRIIEDVDADPAGELS